MEDTFLGINTVIWLRALFVAGVILGLIVAMVLYYMYCRWRERCRAKKGIRKRSGRALKYGDYNPADSWDPPVPDSQDLGFDVDDD